MTSNAGIHQDQYMYIDAVGYSWDSEYIIGDNLNEGMLISFNNNTNLEWIGFSLDSQPNRTIYGNKTIKMPDDGLHTIELHGNNSVGTYYSSGIRYLSSSLMSRTISS